MRIDYILFNITIILIYIFIYAFHLFFLNIVLFLTSLIALILLKYTVLSNNKDLINKKLYFKIIRYTNITYLIILFFSFVYGAAGGIYKVRGYDRVYDPLTTIWNIKDYYEQYSIVDQGVLFVIIILFAIALNLIFNYFKVFRNLNFSKVNRFILSLIVSVVTAPYLFFIDFMGLFQIFK